MDTRIKVEFNCNGNAAEFFNELMEDARDLFKSNEEKLEQFDSIEYEIKERPQMYVDQIEKIIDNDSNFSSYIYESGSNLDGATIDLIAAAYDLDGDDMSDETLLETIKEIVLMRSNYLARNK
jgi:hypothetical protein